MFVFLFFAGIFFLFSFLSSLFRSNVISYYVYRVDKKKKKCSTPREKENI